MKGHQAMMRFEKSRQRDYESIDRFLDDLESLKRKKKVLKSQQTEGTLASPRSSLMV